MNTKFSKLPELSESSMYWKLSISSRFLKICGEGLSLNVISKLLLNVEFLQVSNVMDKDIKYLTDTTPGNVPVAMILQNLKGVRIEKSEHLQVIFQVKKVENHALQLSKLKFLYLVDLPNLEYVWKVPTQHISLGSLEVVRLIRCGKLKSVFSFSIAQCLVRLEELEIEGCDELEQIVEELEGDEQEISPNTNLEKSLCLSKLRALEIRNCGSLEYIFPKFMALQRLPQLQRLWMDRVSRFKQIWRPAKEREEHDIQKLLPSLTDLTLVNCPELTDTTIHSEQIHLEGDIQPSKLMFINTKSLTLWRIMWDHHNLVPEVDREGLNELTVLHLSLSDSVEYLVDTTKEHVPDNVFTNLVELSLRGMGELRRLCNGKFPKRFLQNLEMLRLMECAELEEVFEIDEFHYNGGQNLLKDSPPYFSLQSLKVVKIFECEKLKSLFSPSLIQSLQLLEELEITSCNELKTVFTELENDGGKTEPSSHDLHPLCLPRLRTLTVYNCARLEYVLPITLAQGLQRLEIVEVSKCVELKQIFGVAKEQDGVENYIKLPLLNHLELRYLPTLSSFGPENYIGNTPVLEKLIVSRCPQLIKCTNEEEVNHHWLHLQKILTPDVEGLTFLKFTDCEDLECLVDTTKENMSTCVMFTTLVELVLQNMIGLEMLCNGQLPDGFLQNLEILKLVSLTELRWMVKGPTEYVSMQNLKVVSIKKCNKLESLFAFSHIQSLRLLERLCISDCDKLKMVFAELESDDETESNKLLASAQSELPHLRKLKLRGLSSLSSFGPENYVIKAPALEYLEVTSCPRLTNFSIQLDKPLQSKLSGGYNFMSSLKTMTLCGLIWQDIWKGPIQVVLTNLGALEVYKCNNLTSIFSPMLVRNLQQLYYLQVKACEKVQTIIVNDDENDEKGIKNDKEMRMFPRLQYLRLSDLPSLMSFSPVGCHLLFPNLFQLDIEDCSLMITSFTVDSKSLVHAKTKIIASKAASI
ncbi:hypothetical protein PTKIN_Ptkin14bG0212100 [Pterospermum kingtungense]